ncbi:MAG: hypothetical protein JWR37_2454 [Mycobacterium sp.]|jgi:hypothetical protein|nr:hypothetical protein [Mycobacterium sp.]
MAFWIVSALAVVVTALWAMARRARGVAHPDVCTDPTCSCRVRPDTPSAQF